MTRVFILSETDYDISDALRYGKLTVVFEAGRPSIFDHARFKDEFKRRVKALGFDHNKDFFLCIGTAVPLLLSQSFLTQDYGWFKALFFHAATQRYVVRVLGDEATYKRLSPIRYNDARGMDGPSSTDG